MNMKNLLTTSCLLMILMVSTVSDANAQKKTAEPTDQLVTISTTFGSIKILLFDDTPMHKKNFLTLAGKGFYNQTSFHRIIPGFMIQAGEDTTALSKGKSFEEITLAAEIRPNRTHKRGALSMARPDNPEKRSDGTQFFIVQSPNGSHFLDNQYTVFGQVMSGMEVVDMIAQQEKDLSDRPLIPIRMTVKVETVKRSDILNFYNYIYE
jgi:cyclophilin family peptidyl-prolyl cis-trans isomerase